jgi:hypothetical protein
VPLFAWRREANSTQAKPFADFPIIAARDIPDFPRLVWRAPTPQLSVRLFAVTLSDGTRLDWLVWLPQYRSPDD